MVNRIRIVQTLPAKKNPEHRLPLTLLGTEHAVESETEHVYKTTTGLIVLKDEAEVVY